MKERKKKHNKNGNITRKILKIAVIVPKRKFFFSKNVERSKAFSIISSFSSIFFLVYDCCSFGNRVVSIETNSTDFFCSKRPSRNSFLYDSSTTRFERKFFQQQIRLKRIYRRWCLSVKRCSLHSKEVSLNYLLSYFFIVINDHPFVLIIPTIVQKSFFIRPFSLSFTRSDYSAIYR